MGGRAARIVLAATVALVCLSGAATGQEGVHSVTVTGESALSYDDAEQRALRDAVRQVAGVMLRADTKVSDFVLIRDAIVSRAAGYVRSYKVLSKQRSLDDTYVVKLRAEVARGAIQDDALAVLNWIELMGRPQFRVRVEDRSDTEQEVAAWVEAALNDYLEETGFNALHAATHGEAVERARARAELQGDATRAAQLGLMMGAPYGVEVVAFGRRWREQAFGVPLTNYKVELGVSVVHRDSGELLASKDAAAIAQDQGDLGVAGFRDACRRAVEEAFPRVLDRILAHWLRDFDVGASIVLRVASAEPEQVYALARKLAEIEGVSQANVEEAPEGGIARVMVISRVAAPDLAERIGVLTGGRLRGYVEGRRTITARPVEEPMVEREPAAHPAAPAKPDYVVPAAILGGCLLLGIVVAAIILRGGKEERA